MGINISLVRKIGYIDTEDEIVIGEPDWEVQKIDWWNPARQVGDRDFLNNIEWERAGTWIEHLRPENSTDALEWIRKNIPPGPRKKDYLRALNDMQTDSNLYFRISR